MSEKDSVIFEDDSGSDNIVVSSLKKLRKDFGRHKQTYLAIFIGVAVVLHFVFALFYQDLGSLFGGTIVLADLLIPIVFINPGLFLVEVVAWFVISMLIVQLRGVYDKPYKYDDRRGVLVVDNQDGRLGEGTNGIGGNAKFMSEEDEEKQFIRSKTLDDFALPILGIDDTGHFCAKNPKTPYTNGNASIVGCPGSGKSACYVLPAIYQSIRGGQSFVVTDSKGSIYRESAYFAEKAGFTTKVLNFKPEEMFASDGVNFMKAIHSSMDASSMTTIIMKNTNDGKKEDYWFDAESNLLLALISYVAFDDSIKPEERTLAKVYNLLIENTPDQLADIFATLKPRHPAYASGMTFVNTPPNPRQSTHSGLAIRLNLLSQPVVQDFLSHDEVDFRKPMTDPCAYYVIISDTNDTAKFLACLFFSMMFSELYNEADDRYHGQPPMSVNFILDEFKATGSIRNFGNILSTSRSRKINVSFILQDIQQLETMYPDEWHTLINDCTLSIYIKSREMETLQYFSKMYGYQTILDRGKRYEENARTLIKTHQNYNMSESFKKRELLTTDDLTNVVTNDELVINLEGKHTIILHKFNYWTHPFYKILVDEAHDGARPKFLSAKEHVPQWRQDYKAEHGVDPYLEDQQNTPEDDYDPELEEARRNNERDKKRAESHAPEEDHFGGDDKFKNRDEKRDKRKSKLSQANF